MKLGKVSQSVLKRSVLKCIDEQRQQAAVIPAAGEDCAVLRLEEGGDLFLAQGKSAPYLPEFAGYAVTAAANKIAAQGGTCIGLTVHLMFPAKTREIQVNRMMEELAAAAASQGIGIYGGHTELTDAVMRPLISMTGIGTGSHASFRQTAAAKPGQDVVMTKWIGLEGTAMVARGKKEELLTRLPEYFIDAAAAFDKHLSVIPEAATAVKSGAGAMHAVSEGGIFGALWELADCAGVGLSIDLKKIPVRQETIEISEFYHISPYELLSGGSLLITADHGHELAERLSEQGISAAVIGRTTAGNDRIVRNEDEIRYLEPAKMDEIYKVFFKEQAQ